MSFGDFTQQELRVSHLHFLTYYGDRAGSAEGKERTHFEENTFERLMEVLFSVLFMYFNVHDLYCKEI